MAKTLMLISFLLYLFFGLEHSIILAPTSRLKKERTGTPFVTADDLMDMYYANKPGILRKVKFLDLCVQHNFFFYVAAIFFLIAGIWDRMSMFGIVSIIPGAVLLFVILEHLMTAIGFLVDNQKRKK